jgi:hypothetical protein
MVHQVHLLDPTFYPSLVAKDALYVNASFFRPENIHGFHDEFFDTVLDEVSVGFAHSHPPLTEPPGLARLDESERSLYVFVLAQSKATHFPDFLSHRIPFEPCRFLGQLLVETGMLPVVMQGTLQPNNEDLPGCELGAACTAGRMVMMAVVLVPLVRRMMQPISAMLTHVARSFRSISSGRKKETKKASGFEPRAFLAPVGCSMWI